MNNIRWKQRFENFERAYLLFMDAVNSKSHEEMSRLEQEGLVQRFEYTFELAWKTMKDFLELQGAQIPSPKASRNVIKEAFAFAIIEDGQCWINMMDKRNELSHEYDSDKFVAATIEIRQKFAPAFQQLYHYLKPHYDSAE